ncbi:hypothetical protein [Vibrio sp. Hal054]|uniref:hypothetical protein n=1 Tax=Vibrio sp. Hal054 TaxID=3035158 RepID=UPI00301CECFA
MDKLTNITDAEVTLFVQTHYKHERLFGRNAQNGWDDNYGSDVVKGYASQLQDLELENPSLLISRHESVTNQIITFNRVSVLRWNYEQLNEMQLREELQAIDAAREPLMGDKDKYKSDTTRREWSLLNTRLTLVKEMLRKAAQPVRARPINLGFHMAASC